MAFFKICYVVKTYLLLLLITLEGRGDLAPTSEGRKYAEKILAFQLLDAEKVINDA